MELEKAMKGVEMVSDRDLIVWEQAVKIYLFVGPHTRGWRSYWEPSSSTFLSVSIVVNNGISVVFAVGRNRWHQRHRRTGFRRPVCGQIDMLYWRMRAASATNPAQWRYEQGAVALSNVASASEYSLHIACHTDSVSVSLGSTGNMKGIPPINRLLTSVYDVVAR